MVATTIANVKGVAKMSEFETNKSAIIYKFEKLMPFLSAAEKKATEYIIQNPEKVVGFSVASLAEAAGVSEPTIVRACRSLGFSGYQNFKIALAQDIVKPQEFVNEQISPEDDTQLTTGNNQTQPKSTSVAQGITYLL